VNQEPLVFLGVADTAGNALGGTPGNVTRRVSDLAIGNAGSEPVKPVLAFYTNPDDRRWDAERGGIGSISVFDCTLFLQDKDLTVQADLSPDISIAATSLYFDTDVASSFVASGLWLPGGSGTMGLVPAENDIPPANRIPQSVPGSPAWRREYHLANTHPDIYGGARFDFFVRFSTGIYSARLERPLAPDWYRYVRPWSFFIHEPRGMKGKVDIFHNVVNPQLGESVKIYYVLEREGEVTVSLFDLAGRFVDVLCRGRQSKGEHSTAWNGKNRGTKIVAPGVYFVRIVGPDLDETRKILIVK
jgi:fibronectin-binding autotransporter adhesin